MGMLTGLLYCGDCGAKMYQVRGQGWAHDKEYFTCATYRKRKGECTSHQIRNVVIEQIVLEQLRKIFVYATEDEGKFADMIRKQKAVEQGKKLRKKNASMKKRSSAQSSSIPSSRGYMRTTSAARCRMSDMQRWLQATKPNRKRSTCASQNFKKHSVQSNRQHGKSPHSCSRSKSIQR
ncbi:MAG: hypothetical protein E7598_06350 [Ruminococcaceae bacterium]|nr:hypothetical protein [Oscillospiraceae bacterium]